MIRVSHPLFLHGFVAGVALVASAAYATSPLPPSSFWPPEGLTVSRQEGEQWTGDVAASWGSAFVAWLDQSGGPDSVDLYLQKVTPLGEIGWPARQEGFPLCTAPGRQFMPRMARDDFGGIYAAWYDERGASPDIYLQHVRWDGELYAFWPVDGLPVCTAPGIQSEPVVVAGIIHEVAYIAWEDSRDGAQNTHVYLQRITAFGGVDPDWPVDGIRVSNANGIEFQPAITPTRDGGVFVTWVRQGTDGASANVFTTRITPSGTIAPGWPDSGLVVCGATGRQDMPSTIADGDDGVYVAWRDYRDEVDLSGENRSDVYARRVTGLGQFPPGWSEDGLAVRADSVDQWIPKIAPDGLGGLLISWWSVPEVFVQRITPEGTVAPGWTPGGVSVGTTAATGQGPALAGDGYGGAIVAWNDYRGPSVLDVYAQRISDNGLRAPHWPPGGAQVSSGIGQEQVGGNTARVSTIVPDGAGGAIVFWTDFDAPFGADVKAQRVTTVGVAGPQECYFGCANAIVSLSPNPGRGRFRVGARMPPYGSRAVIEAYDVHGRKVRSRSYEGLQPGGRLELDLDLSGLATGVYYLRFTAPGIGGPQRGSRKVVVVR